MERNILTTQEFTSGESTHNQENSLKEFIFEYRNRQMIELLNNTPSWGFNGQLANQEIPCILLNSVLLYLEEATIAS